MGRLIPAGTGLLKYRNIEIRANHPERPDGADLDDDGLEGEGHLSPRGAENARDDDEIGRRAKNAGHHDDEE